MLIAQISDTHILSQQSDHPAADQRADCLRRTVADINRQQPDVVVFTGDTVQHGQVDEYERLRDLLAPLEAPLYLVPGNRDDKDVLRSAFDDFDYLPVEGDVLHYVAEGDPIRLVALDSTRLGERKGVFDQGRQAWLEATLSAHSDQPTLLFIHHPPFDVGDHYVGGYREANDAQALADIVQRHEQVVGFICGHVHWPIEREWAGTQARIMPSIAIDVRKGVDASNDAPVYFLHRIAADTPLDSRLITAG